MLKAVFEVLCNSGDKIAFLYDDFCISEKNKRLHAIAFVLFVAKLWNKKNCKDDNAIIVQKWGQFRSALGDLGLEGWKLSNDKDSSDILIQMIKGIAECSNKSVDEYFVNTDFETVSPFLSFEIMDDLKCRVIERKIKSKLIIDGAVVEKDINKVPVGNLRWGYLYYICGYLSDWNLSDWRGKAKWAGTELNAYIELIKDKDSLEELMKTRNAKVAFAYASQYDYSNKSLRGASDINKCNNEHIWKHDYLEWNDTEYGKIAEEKQKLLYHFKVMLDLLISFKARGVVSNEKLVEKFVDDINLYFSNNTGYEECWLRFAAKYPTGGKDLLDSELENENGVVTMKSVPVLIKTYLIEHGHTYVDKISRLKDFNKKSNYFVADENKVLFSSTDITYTFAPDIDNSGKYQHSQNASWGWDLSGNTVNRNMDLSYRAYLNLSGIGKTIKNNFWTIDIAGGKFTVKVYEISGIKNCKLIVNVSEVQIDTNSISLTEKNLSQWKSKFEALEKEPKKTGSYDHWIELWNNDYQTAFGPSFIQSSVSYDKNGGQRPRKVWSEVISVPTLNWSVSTVEI